MPRGSMQPTVSVDSALRLPCSHDRRRSPLSAAGRQFKSRQRTELTLLDFEAEAELVTVPEDERLAVCSDEKRRWRNGARGEVTGCRHATEPRHRMARSAPGMRGVQQ